MQYNLSQKKGLCVVRLGQGYSLFILKLDVGRVLGWRTGCVISVISIKLKTNYILFLYCPFNDDLRVKLFARVEVKTVLPMQDADILAWLFEHETSLMSDFLEKSME